MYVNESLKMKELKKLFQDNSFIEEPMSVKRILEKLNVSSEKEKIEALRHILSRMQQGENMDCVFNDVIKAIDTRSVELKRLTNIYIKKYTEGKTIRQLLCVNTLLKDLTDKSEEIKIATLEIIGFMGDDVILTNYVNRLKHLTNGSKSVQMSLLDTLGRLPGSLQLGEVLRDFAYSNDPQLSAKALGILAVSPENSLLRNDELLDLLKKKENNLQACYALMKMVYRRRNSIQVDLSTLNKFLKKGHLSLFFFTSSVLLHMDPTNRQVVYDASLLFLKSTDERLYHILLFQEPLLDHVSYENSTYLIYEDDPLFIKRQKVKMLFHRLDDTSIYELTRNSKGELVETILRHGLKKNFVISDIFSLSFNLVDILFADYPFSETFTHLVKNYLLQVTPTSYGTNTIKKYLFLAGNICEERPKALDEIEDLNDSSIAYDILKFYLTLFKRKILDEKQLVETIQGLKKKEKFREKAKLILDLIASKGPFVLFDFADTRLFETPEVKEVQLDLGRHKGDEKKDILLCKPYTGTLSSMAPLKECLSKESEMTPVPYMNCSSEKEDWKTKPSLFLSPSGDVMVDTAHLKGTLFLTKDAVKLEIDILENPLKVSFGVGRLKERVLEKEETVYLMKVGLEDIGRSFKLIISNSVFEILIDLKKLITPFKCSLNDFEEAFKNLSTYKIVEKFEEASLYFVDDSSFSFQVLDAVVYGKNFCNQVVLKGDKEVLRVFQ